MVEKNNAVCSICGSPYHLCLSCKDSMKLHPWKIHCCSSECYKTFQIVKGFNNKVYTKEEAKDKFKNVDLKNLKNFVPHIKKIVKDILKEGKVEVVVESTEKNENTVVEYVAKIADVKVEETKIEENIVKPTVSRKRNYKTEE